MLKQGYKTIIGILLILFCTSACFNKEPIVRSPVVYEGYEDYVIPIYDEMREYIWLDLPASEPSGVRLDVYFTDNYLNDEEMMEEHPQYEIIDRYMFLVNELISEKPDYFFGGDKRIYVQFYGEDFTDHHDEVARLSNRTSKIIEDKLCAVEYHCSVQYDKLTCRDDIEYVYLSRWPDSIDSFPDYVDYVCDVIDLFPNLKEVNYSGGYYDWHKVTEEVGSRYPDIIVGN